jgi:hypothetical protein
MRSESITAARSVTSGGTCCPCNASIIFTIKLLKTLRNIIEMQQVHDTSVREIAEIAGISVTAAKSCLWRARTALRRSLR